MGTAQSLHPGRAVAEGLGGEGWECLETVGLKGRADGRPEGRLGRETGSPPSTWGEERPWPSSSLPSAPPGCCQPDDALHDLGAVGRVCDGWVWSVCVDAAERREEGEDERSSPDQTEVVPT